MSSDAIDEEVRAALKSLEHAKAAPENGIILGKQSTTSESEKAIDQYKKRELSEYEHCSLRLIELSDLMKQGGASQRVCEMLAKSALLLAEVYIARREGVS